MSIHKSLLKTLISKVTQVVHCQSILIVKHFQSLVPSNEIETTGSGNQIQIGLPDNVTDLGNLTVSGTTTTVNSTTVSIADPVFEIGDDSSDDNLDRGIKFKYNSSGAKVGFFGFDDSTGKFN